jgi:hypothetical protein
VSEVKVTHDLVELTPGQRYYLRHRLASQRADRWSVMNYLGPGSRKGSHQFDARPAAGTQTLGADEIKDIHLVSDKVHIVVNSKQQLYQYSDCERCR